MLRAMVGIGIACALMIVLTFQGTLPAIEKGKAEALERAIFRVLPGAATKKTFIADAATGQLSEAGPDAEGERLYVGYDNNGQLTGVAIEASGMGFADILRILYGYDPVKGEIVGFYVLESKETPGLGDKIEKDEDFLANFDGLPLALTEDGDSLKHTIYTVKSGKKENPWEVDGITGATISSRAIGDILGKSTQKWAPLIQDNLENLISSAQNIENQLQ